MEQLVLLLVIAAISLVNWLIERSAKLREQRRLEKEAANRGEPAPVFQPKAPAPREEIQEQMRRMLESFGLPVEEPRPVIQKPTEAATVQQPVALPPLPLTAPSPAMTRPALRRTQSSTVLPRSRSPWLSRLSNPNGLREAVVLREILGPPKALSEL